MIGGNLSRATNIWKMGILAVTLGYAFAISMAKAADRQPDLLAPNPALSINHYEDDPQDPVDTTYVYETRDTLYVTYSPIVVASPTGNWVNSEQSSVTRENGSHPGNDSDMAHNNSSTAESAEGQALEGDEINQSALAVKRARSLQNKEEKLKAFNQSFSKLMELKKQREWREEQQKLIRQREEALRGGILSGGMILDETQTRMGRNFYTIFYDNWRPPSGALNFMITISERMMPSRGTSVSIEIDDVLVFQARLQPRYSFIEEVARQAVAVCQQKLYQMQLQSNQLQTF